MKPKLCLLALLCLVFEVSGQNKKGGLSIGDKVPNVIIPNVINYPTSQVELSSFSGKLLILDFWATWCSPCLAMFPKTDSLQKAFDGRVQFLSITHQPKEIVEKFWAKSKRLSVLSPAIATDDKTLGSFFPHSVLPHYVWIDPRGTVIAITGSEEITLSKISSALSLGELVAPVKVDVDLPYASNELFLLQNLGITKKEIRFQSLFTRYVSGLSSRQEIQRDAIGNIKHLAVSNVGVTSLFALAFSRNDLYFARNRISVEVKDPSITSSTLGGRAFVEWLQKNGYCYELVIPDDMALDAHAVMRSDLARFLPQYEAHIEKRVKPCLVLERTSKVDKLKSSGGEASYSMDANSANVNNDTMMLLQQILAHYLQHLDLPIVDATGYGGKIDLLIEADMANLDDLRKGLRKYDLDLVPRDHEIEILVIKDSAKPK